MINKLRTKPRDKAVYKDTVRCIPAFIVCLALSVYSLIAYFSFADFPLYSVIAFPVITAVVVLFAVLGIVRGRKKAFRFSTAGKDDRYPTVMIMQVMPADNKTPFPTAYLEYYPCGAEPVKQYAELEADRPGFRQRSGKIIRTGRATQRRFGRLHRLSGLCARRRAFALPQENRVGSTHLRRFQTLFRLEYCAAQSKRDHSL